VLHVWACVWACFGCWGCFCGFFVCCVVCACDVRVCACLYALGGFRVCGDGYMCRLVWALCDRCMREYVGVLIVDGQNEETGVEWGYWV
jgi:hypothetical protein